MNLQTHQLFAQLCESIVFEDSTTMDLIKGLPGGQQVVKFLHQAKSLSHDQAYKQVEKISWNDLKDAYKGSWVIMKYPRGVGAIQQRGGSYEAVASTGGEVEEFSDSRGGNIMDFLKEKLGGKPSVFYVGNDKGTVKDIKSKRAGQNKNSAGGMTEEKLLQKFRPLWVRAATAAIADMKGMVGIMLKNDSFEKASNKLSQIKDLSNALSALESDSESTPSAFKTAVNAAVVLSASHYYPDETGAINNTYRGMVPDNQTGIQHLLRDISEGDTSKLGTILSFFKRSLMTR
jgi:hypothetical protein